MEVLRKIHALTIGDNCFNNAVSIGEIEQLMNMFEHLEEETLLKLTILHRLFSQCLERKSCGKLTDICNYLIDNGVVLKLVPLMDVTNQHVVFMTAKAMTTMILFKPCLIKKYILNTLFENCLEFEWKAIYIMKMLAQIVDNLREWNSRKNILFRHCTCKSSSKQSYYHDDIDSAAHAKEMNKDKNGYCCENVSTASCGCISSSTQSYHHDYQSHAAHIGLMIQDSEVVLSLYVSLWKDVFDEYRLRLSNKDFMHGTNSVKKFQDFHMIIGSMTNQIFNDEKMKISKKIQDILLSFLQFLIVLFKWIVHLNHKKNVCDYMSDVNDEKNTILMIKGIKELLEVIPVFAYLLQVKGLSPEVWKNILGLLSLCIEEENFAKRSSGSQRFFYTLSHQVVEAVLSSINFGALGSIPLYSGFEGFGGQKIAPLQDNEMEPSVQPRCSVLRQVSLLIIKASLVTVAGIDEGAIKSVQNVLSTWSSYLLDKAPPIKDRLCEILLDLFVDQDDDMIHMMLLLLKLYQCLVKTTLHGPKNLLPINNINPHIMFTEFLSILHFDHSVLLDFLVSCETVFLEYIMGYLQLVVHDWEGFCQESQDSWNMEENSIDQCMPSAGYDQEDVEIYSCIAGLGCLSGISKAYGSDGDDDDVGNGDDYNDCNDHDGDGDDHVNVGDGGGDDDVSNDHVNICNDVDDVGNDEDYIGDDGYGDDYDNGDDDDDVDGDDDNDGDDDDDDDNDVDGDDDNDGDNDIIYDVIDDVNDYDNEKFQAIHNFNCSVNTNLETKTISGDNCNSYPVSLDMSSSSTLEKTMSTLIHLRISIQRLNVAGLFPYNAGPLLRKLRTIEELFDGC